MNTESVVTTDGHTITCGDSIYDADGNEYSFQAMHQKQYLCHPVIEVEPKYDEDDAFVVANHLVVLPAVYHTPPLRRQHSNLAALKETEESLRQQIARAEQEYAQACTALQTKQHENALLRNERDTWTREIATYEKNYTSLKELRNKIYKQETGELGFLHGLFHRRPYIYMYIGYNQTKLADGETRCDYPGPLTFDPTALAYTTNTIPGELQYDAGDKRYYFVPSTATHRYSLPAAVAAINERLAREVSNKFWADGVTTVVLDRIAALVAKCDQINAEYNVSIIVPDELRNLPAVVEEAQRVAKEERRARLLAALAKIDGTS